MGTYSSNHPVKHIGQAVHGLGSFKIQVQRVDPTTVRWKTPHMLSHIKINHHVSDAVVKDLVKGHVQRSYQFIKDRKDV